MGAANITLRACSQIKAGPPSYAAFCSRFSEGFETADLKAGKAHLNFLQ
jgi:hypothetical protein